MLAVVEELILKFLADSRGVNFIEVTLATGLLWAAVGLIGSSVFHRLSSWTRALAAAWSDFSRFSLQRKPASR